MTREELLNLIDMEVSNVLRTPLKEPIKAPIQIFNKPKHVENKPALESHEVDDFFFRAGNKKEK